MDSSNGRTNTKSISKKVKNYMKELGIVDIWRFKMLLSCVTQEKAFLRAMKFFFCCPPIDAD